MNNITSQIYQQLGASKFVAMTGAKDFCSGSNMLQFKFGRGAINKANLCQITLQANDTYMMQFYSVRNLNCKSVGNITKDIYVSDLQNTFTLHTGFDTHL